MIEQTYPFAARCNYNHCSYYLVSVYGNGLKKDVFQYIFLKKLCLNPVIVFKWSFH